MRTPEQIEKDYQLGKDLQKSGYIRPYWEKKRDPDRFPGNRIINEMRERNENITYSN